MTTDSNLNNQEENIASQESSNHPQVVSNENTSHPQKRLSLSLIIVFLVCAFVGGLLIATGYFQYKLQQISTSKLAAKGLVPQPKFLIIGTDATAPPMESVNKEGSIVGYDADLAYRITNEIGMKAEIKNIPWDNIFTALQGKKIDMIISSVTITDERKQKYAFSDPYINAGQVIVSRKDHPFTSPSELMGKKLSVQKGTTNEKEALKLTSPNLVISYDDFVAATKALASGQVDAMISDLTLAKGFIGQYDNLKITSDPFTNEYYGIVLRKDNTDLLKKVNDAISVLRVKGILTDLQQKWLD